MVRPNTSQMNATADRSRQGGAFTGLRPAAAAESRRRDQADQHRHAGQNQCAAPPRHPALTPPRSESGSGSARRDWLPESPAALSIRRFPARQGAADLFSNDPGQRPERCRTHRQSYEDRHRPLPAQPEAGRAMFGNRSRWQPSSKCVPFIWQRDEDPFTQDTHPGQLRERIPVRSARIVRLSFTEKRILQVLPIKAACRAPRLDGSGSRLAAPRHKANSTHRGISFPPAQREASGCSRVALRWAGAVES